MGPPRASLAAKAPALPPTPRAGTHGRGHEGMIGHEGMTSDGGGNAGGNAGGDGGGYQTPLCGGAQPYALPEGSKGGKGKSRASYEASCERAAPAREQGERGGQGGAGTGGTAYETERDVGSDDADAEGKRREPFNFTPMGVNPISSGSPHVRPMGRTCGGPDEIKKNTHSKYFTALFREQGRLGIRMSARYAS